MIRLGGRQGKTGTGWASQLHQDYWREGNKEEKLKLDEDLRLRRQHGTAGPGALQ